MDDVCLRTKAIFNNTSVSLPLSLAQQMHKMSQEKEKNPNRFCIVQDSVSLFEWTDSIYFFFLNGRIIILVKFYHAEWYKFMEVNKIYQIPRIISQEQIQSSDLLSCLVTRQDTQLLHSEFIRVCSVLLISPEIDLFATRFSTKLDHFYSHTQDPCALGTNAFLHSWTSKVVYAFPPPCLIQRTISKI